MGDSENVLPPSKKRAAGREISKENPGLDDEEDFSELEAGTFKRASDDVLANRRIVKVRRNPTTSTTSSNPFAGIRLVPPAAQTPAPALATIEEVATSEKAPEEVKNDNSEETEKGTEDTSKQSENKIDETADGTVANKESTDDTKNDDTVNVRTDTTVNVPTDTTVNEPTETKVADEMPREDDQPGNDKAGGDNTESEDKKDNGSVNVDASAEETPLSSFQQLSSSQNAFTGLAGTGFSTTTFTFGSVSKDGSASDANPSPLFGQKSDQPSFGFGLPANGSSSLFNTTGSSLVSKSEGSGFPSKQEVPVETGEENERVVFSADSVLFEYLDNAWKERGKGEVKVNISASGTERARLVMRARGNYRLILNASLFPDMKLTNMEKRGITFACINSIGDGKDGLSTFALKFKDSSVVEEFRAAVTEHKGKTATVLKTPENSPKASEE